MARAILLIILIAATASLYQAKRTQRLEAALDRREAGRSLPTDRSPDPPGASDVSRPDSHTRRSSPLLLPALDVDQREGLRDALEDWGTVPREILIAEVDRVGRREIAVAAFRALLAERARETASSPGVTSARRLELERGRTVLLLDPERTRDDWSGTTIDGERVQLPVDAVRANDPATIEEVRSARRALRTTEVARAIAHGEAGVLTRLLLGSLADDDYARAEELFAAWISGHGPALIADTISPPERRSIYRSLARALRGPTGELAAHDATTVPGTPLESSPPETRSIETLERFLETGRRMRELSEEERTAALLECTRWESWITDRIEGREETAGDLPRLLRDLRQLRFDLVKTSGF